MRSLLLALFIPLLALRVVFVRGWRVDSDTLLDCQ